MARTTHTLATLNVSQFAYEEIEKALKDAGYEHAIVDGLMDMSGIGLAKKSPEMFTDFQGHEDRVGEDVFTCGSRLAQGRSVGKDVDVWMGKPNGDRTCSYCGSMHPEDFEKYLKEAADAESEVLVSRSDKMYKWYVQQPNVSNASQGAIKFYTWHGDTEEWIDRFNVHARKALHESNRKWQEKVAKTR